MPERIGETKLIKKSRKKKLCNGCGQMIDIGDSYFTQTNVDGGEIYQWNNCLKCESFSNKYPELCYTWGETEQDEIGVAIEYWEDKNGEYKF